MSARYGIYYAPPDEHPLWGLGCQWLGRDPISGDAITQPPIDGHDLATITATPRRYGFHATLKPPFRLADGGGEDELLEAVAALAANTVAFDIDLRLAPLHGFLALRPAVPCQAMEELAATCVKTLDHFRAPATEPELAKRRAAGLNPDQEALLLRWGYPFVLDQYRFHLTLSERLDSEALAHLQYAFADWAGTERFDTVPVDGVCVYRQGDMEQPFRLLRRIAFRGPGAGVNDR